MCSARPLRFAAVFCVYSLTTLMTVPLTECTPESSLDHILQNKDLAQNRTDEFSWKVFAQIVRPATNSIRHASVDGADLSLYPTLWETWAEDVDIFHQQPLLQNPPTWEGRNKHGDRRKWLFDDPLSPRELERLISSRKDSRAKLIEPFPPSGCIGPSCLEVRHNKYDFDSIVKSRIWYQEGLKIAYNAPRDKDGIPETVQMDTRSIEIKAGWRLKQSTDDLSHYHVYCEDPICQDPTKKVFVLVALHIMTKALNKWTWSTFEQEDNPARCDVYGCVDHYGSAQWQIPSNSQPSKGYAPQSLSRKAALDLRDLPNEWKHYCLKGSQTLYPDKGPPTKLGNSILESNVNPRDTASCISCHARARINAKGVPADDNGFLEGHRGPVGPPQAPPPDSCRPIGFIWSVRLAKSIHPAPSPAEPSTSDPSSPQPVGTQPCAVQ